MTPDFSKTAAINRRDAVLAICAAAVVSASPAHSDEKETKLMSDDEPTYASNGIELKNFERFWPKPHKVPQLIIDVAKLIGPWPWGVLSHFYITASRPNDYLIENGADLWNQFGMFVGIANGTEYAVWYYEGCPPGAEPVVSFGDEGDLSILAPNLRAFFTQWATGVGVGMLEPFDYDATPKVLATRKNYGAKVMALLNTYPIPAIAPNPPDFDSFITKFADRARDQNANDPNMKSIAKLLAAYFPADDTNPRGKSFKLIANGDEITIETSLMAPDYVKEEPLPEREALIPLIQVARLDRAKVQNDGRGLWTSGVLYLQHGGHVLISGEWA